MNILFVCSRNKWRSRTAETIFKNRAQDIVKSAGTEKGARIPVSSFLLKWADRIFVMEEKHEDKLEKEFASIVANKEMVVLGIPDIYKYMDSELIEILEISTQPYLNQEIN